MTRFDWWPKPEFQLGDVQPGPLVLCRRCMKSKGHQIHRNGHDFLAASCVLKGCTRWATEIDTGRKLGPFCGNHYAAQKRAQDAEIKAARKRRYQLDMEKETSDGLKWLANRMDQHLFGTGEPQTLTVSPQAFEGLKEALEGPSPIHYAKEDAESTLELYKHQAAVMAVAKTREDIGLPPVPAIPGSIPIRIALDPAFPDDSMLLVGKNMVMAKLGKDGDDDG